MSTKLKSLILALACVSASACGSTVRLGGGRAIYLLGTPQQVIVNNNKVQAGDLYRNNEYFSTLEVGESVAVPLPYDAYSNAVLTFKAFTLDKTGRKVYYGQATKTFYVQSGSNYNQEWTVDMVNVPR